MLWLWKIIGIPLRRNFEEKMLRLLLLLWKIYGNPLKKFEANLVKNVSASSPPSPFSARPHRWESSCSPEASHLFNICIVDKCCCLVVYENSRAASHEHSPGVFLNLSLLTPDDPVRIAGNKARARNGVLDQPTVAGVISDIWESEERQHYNRTDIKVSTYLTSSYWMKSLLGRKYKSCHLTDR